MKRAIFILMGFFGLTIMGQAQTLSAPGGWEVVPRNPVGVYPKLNNKPAWDGRDPGTYRIEFRINGMQPGAVYLADHFADAKYLRDTAMADARGVAVFKGTKKLQRGMYLFVFNGKSEMFELVIDEDQDFTIIADTSWSGDYYAKMKVVGHEGNAGFVDYQKNRRVFAEKRYYLSQDLKVLKDSLAGFPEKPGKTEKVAKDAVQKAYTEKEAELRKTDIANNKLDSIYIQKYPNHYLSAFLKAVKETQIPKELPIGANGKPDSTWAVRWYKAHFWDNFTFCEEGLIRSPVNIVKKRIDEYFDNLVTPDPDSIIMEADKLIARASCSREIEKYIIWYITNKFETSKIMCIEDAVFVNMARKYYCTGRAWWCDSATVQKICDNAERMSHTLCQRVAPDLQLMDINGNPQRLFAVEAPYTFVVFWDPTCGHCLKVVPEMYNLYKRNKDKGWKVYSIAARDKEKEWKDYMLKHPELEEWTNVCKVQENTIWHLNLYNYNNISNPTIFILDKDRKVIAKKIDVEKIEDFLKHYEEVMGKRGKS
jgi:thiol-disulfide isomerase/thioredoxin